MSENLKKRTELWLLSLKIQSYFKGQPFLIKENIPNITTLKFKNNKIAKENITTPIVDKETLNKEPIKEKDPISWLELPLYKNYPENLVEILIFIGKLEKENSLHHKTLTPEEEETLDKWMKAIEVKNYAVKRFPWSENNLSIKYPEIENWFYKTLKNINPKIVLILGEENISLLTGYPVILNFTHGIEFPLPLKDLTFPIIASYSPKDLSFNPHLKRQIWEDLKRVKGTLFNI